MTTKIKLIIANIAFQLLIVISLFSGLAPIQLELTGTTITEKLIGISILVFVPLYTLLFSMAQTTQT